VCEYGPCLPAIVGFNTWESYVFCIRLCVYICGHMYVCVYICGYMYVYIYICGHIYMYMYICGHMYMYIYICGHMHVYIYMGERESVCISRYTSTHMQLYRLFYRALLRPCAEYRLFYRALNANPKGYIKMHINTYGVRCLRLVGFLKVYVSFAEYRLFYWALLQKRPVI